MSEENNELIPCINCNKPIAKDAAFCSFCGKEQKIPEKKLPGQIRLLILNLMCPGAGAWCLGEKLRGTIIFIIVIGALIGYCYDVIPIIQKAVNDAILHNKLGNLYKLDKQLSGNGWMYAFTISYIFSIIDSIFLRINKQRSLDESKNVTTK